MKPKPKKPEPDEDELPLPRPPGRPSGLTPKVLKNILTAIRIGETIEGACASAGIGARTFYRWMERGRMSKKGDYWQFWQRVQKAESQARVRHLANIDRAAGMGDWRASAFILERRHPKDFGRKVDIQAERDTGVKIIFEDAFKAVAEEEAKDDGETTEEPKEGD